MRLVKLIITLVIIGLIALFIYQNMTAWTGTVPFNINLWILGKTEWILELYLIILISAIIGLLIGVILMLKPYFRVRRTLARERQERKEAAQAEIPPAKDNQAQSVQG
jgi:uncharacterized integral membrane protein